MPTIPISEMINSPKNHIVTINNVQTTCGSLWDNALIAEQNLTMSTEEKKIPKRNMPTTDLLLNDPIELTHTILV